MNLRTGLRGPTLAAMLAGGLLLGVALGGCEDAPIAAKAPAGETQTNPLPIALDSKAVFYSTSMDAAYFSLGMPVATPSRVYTLWVHPRPVNPSNLQSLTVFADPGFTTLMGSDPTPNDVKSFSVLSGGGTVYAWVPEKMPAPTMSFLIAALSDGPTGVPVTGSATSSVTPQPLAAGQTFAGSVSTTASNYFAVTIAGPGLHQFKVTGSPGVAVPSLFSDATFATLMNLPTGACIAAFSVCLADAPAAGLTYPATLWVIVSAPGAPTAIPYSLSVIGP